MKKYRLSIILVELVFLFFSAFSFGIDPNENLSIRFLYIKEPEPSNQSTINILAKGVDFQNWPKSQNIRVAPKEIAKAILENPQQVTEEHFYFSFADCLNEKIFLEQEVNFRRFEENKDVPKELPEERKREILERLSPKIRDDPNMVKEILEAKTRHYIESKQYILKGDLTITITPTEDNRAAQEFLLMEMIGSNMPIEAIADKYSKVIRYNEIGNISFITESRNKDDILVKYIRDNILIQIRGNGCFADEVVSLAIKIDASLLQQPSLTYEQLLAKRATLKEIKVDEKKKDTNVRGVSIDVQTPQGQKIISLEAEVNGNKLPVKDGKLYLEGKKGRVKVKITAITDELLVSTFEEELMIEE